MPASRFLAALAVAFAVAALLVVPARADFAAGVEAYDGGDFTKAFAEWLPLARQGDPAAERNIGHMYRLGRGVERDPAKAVKWYRRAAEKGLARAQANLANMYLAGEGVPRDYGAAARWLYLAAVQGHVIAQYNLGQMYLSGLGVRKDPVRAMAWYNLAAKAGYQKALDKLSLLVAASGPPEIVADNVLEDGKIEVTEMPPPPAASTAAKSEKPSVAKDEAVARATAEPEAQAAASPPAEKPAKPGFFARLFGGGQNRNVPEAGEADEPDTTNTAIVADKTGATDEKDREVAASAAISSPPGPPSGPPSEKALSTVKPVEAYALPAPAAFDATRQAGLSLVPAIPPPPSPSERIARQILAGKLAASGEPYRRSAPARLAAPAPPEDTPSPPAKKAATVAVEVPLTTLRLQPAMPRAMRPSEKEAWQILAGKLAASGDPYRQTALSGFFSPTVRFDWDRILKKGPQAKRLDAAIEAAAEAGKAPMPPEEELTFGTKTRLIRTSNDSGLNAIEAGLLAYRARDYATAMAYWLPLAHAGRTRAQFYVGGLYHDGTGVAADRTEAYMWWAIAAERGYLPAVSARDQLATQLSDADRRQAEARARAWRPTRP